jgi:hypothetical protein
MRMGWLESGAGPQRGTEVLPTPHEEDEMRDADVQRMLDRLKIQIGACQLNPTIGNVKVLEDAHKMIYTLRNKLRFRKDYD